MKLIIKFIKKFQIPILALLLILVLYFGFSGLNKEVAPEKTKGEGASALLEKDLKIAKADKSQEHKNIKTQEQNNSSTRQPANTQINQADPQVTNTPAEKQKEDISQKVTTKINAGRYAGNYLIDHKENESAFDLLLRVAEVDYEIDPSWGAFVKAIGGLYNDSNYAWFFYVNGTLWGEGSSSYIVQPSDVIDWRYHEWWTY